MGELDEEHMEILEMKVVDIATSVEASKSVENKSNFKFNQNMHRDEMYKMQKSVGETGIRQRLYQCGNTW